MLSAVGLYGVMSYAVGQRRREIGVRIALGAQHRHILRLVLGNGIVLVSIGVAIGLVSAFGFTRLMASLLFGVAANDPGTYAAVSLLLIAVAMCACYIPTRRAASLDTMDALRSE